MIEGSDRYSIVLVFDVNSISPTFFLRMKDDPAYMKMAHAAAEFDGAIIKGDMEKPARGFKLKGDFYYEVKESSKRKTVSHSGRSTGKEDGSIAANMCTGSPVPTINRS